MTPEEKELFDIWKAGSLAEATAELASYRQAFLNQPIALFNRLVAVIGNAAREDFMKIFRLAAAQEFDEMSIEIKNNYTIGIVSALNAALPLDYPFIVALVYSDQTPQMRMCSMDRKVIPGVHDMLSPAVVPIVHLRETCFGETGTIKFFPEDVEFMS